MTAQPVKGLSYAGKDKQPFGVFFPVVGVFVAVRDKEEHDRRAEQRRIYKHQLPERKLIIF